MGKCMYCGKFMESNNINLCDKCNTVQNKIEISKDLVNYSSNNENISKVITQLKSNKHRGSIIIELCNGIKSPIAYWYMIQGYLLKGAKFRPKLIEYCNKILESNYDFNEHTYSLIINILAKAYEGEYMFDDAIKTYNLLLLKYEKYTSAHINIAFIMVKQHKIDDAIEYLENVHQNIESHPYYHKNILTGETELDPTYKSDIRCLPVHIQDLKEKKARGYVYRPRKKNK